MSRTGFHPFDGKPGDEPYLSYYDIRLTRDDIDTLKDDWLTDNVIAFWEEYLEHESLLPNYPHSRVILLRPSMSFMLLQTPDPLTLREALPSFAKTTHIFLPINDCSDVEKPEGGSHWSLLLVGIKNGVAFHYDSLHSANFPPALIVCEKLSKLLDRDIHLTDLKDSPQQENSSDCGVFVCAIMKHLLLRRLLTTPTGREINMSMGQQNVNAKRGREEILKTIEELRKEAKKKQQQQQQQQQQRSRSASPWPNGGGAGAGSGTPRIE